MGRVHNMGIIKGRGIATAGLDGQLHQYFFSSTGSLRQILSCVSLTSFRLWTKVLAATTQNYQMGSRVTSVAGFLSRQGGWGVDGSINYNQNYPGITPSRGYSGGEEED